MKRNRNCSGFNEKQSVNCLQRLIFPIIEVTKLKGSAVADAGAVPAAPRGHLHPPHLAARDRVRALLRRAHAEDLAVSGADSELDYGYYG